MFRGDGNIEPLPLREPCFGLVENPDSVLTGFCAYNDERHMTLMNMRQTGISESFFRDAFFVSRFAAHSHEIRLGFFSSDFLFWSVAEKMAQLACRIGGF